jgi:hypothetical protein
MKRWRLITMTGDGKTHMFLAGRRFDLTPDQLKENMTSSHKQLEELADLVRPTGNIAEVDEKLGSITEMLDTGTRSLSGGDIEHAELMWGFALVTLAECKTALDARIRG